MENIIYNELRYRGFNVSVGEIDVNEMTDRIDKNGKMIYAKKVWKLILSQLKAMKNIIYNLA